MLLRAFLEPYRKKSKPHALPLIGSLRIFSRASVLCQSHKNSAGFQVFLEPWKLVFRRPPVAFLRVLEQCEAT